MRHTIAYLLVTLVVLAGCTTEGERAQMRSGLDSINSRNRNDQPFAVQDVAPYVRFFDDHGTPNDRLLAHYLLGRAYYEHGEAPMALKCYHDAVECADTTSADCDYAQLARVYGQMAEIFYHQGLYRQQLELGKQSVKYAWLGRDTLAALMSYEQESFVYKSLGMPDSAIFVIEDVASKYKQYGYPNHAAIALGTIIGTLVDREDYQRAKYCIDTYESKSGLFDVRGNIAKGKEYYYRLKGLYYFSINSLDSAEYYFRKELCDGKDFNNQSAAAKGLTNLYQKLHRNDSAAKYAVYAYAMNDSLYAQRNTKDVERIQAMFDYSRNQELARREKENAANELRKLHFSISFSLLIFAIGIYIIYVLHREKLKQQKLYKRNLEQLEQTQSEILQLRLHSDEYEALLAEKEKLLEQQQAEMQIRGKRLLTDCSTIEKNIRESGIYQILSEKQYGQALNVDELRDCRKLVIENLPEFNNLLLSKQYKLNEKDFNVCILFRLGFRSKEVSNMLNITQGRVSQICNKILHEIFGEDTGGASELIAKLHELY